jgi:FkbM family methyltransferase
LPKPARRERDRCEASRHHSRRSTQNKDATVDYYDFCRRNLVALEVTRHNPFNPSDVYRCNQELGYRGFVNCVAAHGENSFVMFTNADDVVAGHYMYAGPASFETGTLKLWTHLARKSNWIYDIGAFTGVFALAAAAANPACKVMAFEPSFVTYSRLLVNIYGNDFNDRISPIRFGLGANLAELELRHPAGIYVMASGESFLESHISDPWFTEKVPVVSLDHLLSNQNRYRKQIVLETSFDGADLIKIDVEGFEIDVIEGMRDTISTHRPTVIIEILEHSKIENVMNLFGTGYHIKHIAEASGEFTETSEGRNFLIIHDDKMNLLDGYDRTFDNGL